MWGTTTHTTLPHGINLCHRLVGLVPIPSQSETGLSTSWFGMGILDITMGGGESLLTCNALHVLTSKSAFGVDRISRTAYG